MDDEELRMGLYGKQGQEDMVSRRSWGAKWNMAGSDLLSGSHSAVGGGHRLFSEVVPEAYVISECMNACT